MATTSNPMTTASASSSPRSDSSSATGLLYPDLEPELASTRCMLERYPEGKDDWRPHDKSRPLGKLAVHVAELVNLGTIILETDEMDAAKPRQVPTLGTAAELVTFFDQNVERFRPALAAADLDRQWTLRVGEKVFFSHTKRVLVRNMMINHIIHHRAQLGVYYRLLGVPLPGTYGPTADEPM
jgi:uncharacterized damage-inducible protein DinB